MDNSWPHQATTAKAKRSRQDESGSLYPSSKTCGAVNAALRLDETWRCPGCGVLNLRRQGLAADVEGVSDGRLAAVLDEASPRQIIPHQRR